MSRGGGLLLATQLTNEGCIALRRLAFILRDAVAVGHSCVCSSRSGTGSMWRDWQSDEAVIAWHLAAKREVIGGFLRHHDIQAHRTQNGLCLLCHPAALTHCAA